ncbi:MAG TPA: hypothetical protein VFN29_04370 [Chiayiivirga sp.]|nr:hypothetical protein [Chiayiivirga sp.]
MLGSHKQNHSVTSPCAVIRAVGLGLLMLAAAGISSADTLQPMTGVQQLAVGERHSCVVTEGGGVKCWGNNDDGQLGDGSTTSRDRPVQVVGLDSDVIAVSVGYRHSCALMHDGSARCWGKNLLNNLGDGTATERHTPVVVLNLSNAIAIASGGDHNCALIAGGTLKCWGYNGYGELGLGNGNFDNQSTATPVSSLNNVAAITAGYATTCALDNAGTVKCWGVYDRDCGLMGCGFAFTPTPQVVSALGNDVVSISAGEFFQCAVTTAGAVKCWGDNYDNVLGDLGTVDPDPFTPYPISGLGSGVTQVSAGYDHACARLDDGSLRCWGYGGFAQLGDGSSEDHATPVAVAELAGPARVVAAGKFHTCALLADSRVQCWGNNRDGQLGNAEPWQFSTPQAVSGLGSGVVAISTGDMHSCALMDTGSVRCWGSNGQGQLGDGSTTAHTTPVVVSGISNASSISLGSMHTCARTTSGGVQCWGDNAQGQIGDGSFNDRWLPTAVQGLNAPITQLSAGARHNCVLTQSGAAKCWGDNASSQLGGDGTLIANALPVDVYNFNSGGLRISAGGLHTCAVMNDQSVRCWGGNDEGQLGLDDYDTHLVPIVLADPTDAIDIDLGDVHSCAIVSTGTVLCWGGSSEGQIGSSSGEAFPVVPADTWGLDFNAISAGFEHSCAIVDDGSARCWGGNDYGQLGRGTFASSYHAMPVLGLNQPLIAISAGGRHTCALTQTGGVLCWGDNASGQLGIGRKDNTLPGFVLDDPAFFRDGFESE